MHHRLLRVVAIVLVLAARSRAQAAEPPDWMHGMSAFATAVSRHLPRYEVTFEAEDADVETTISFTLLDHVPDWGRAVAVARRMAFRP